jgi:IS5 family transposase
MAIGLVDSIPPVRGPCGRPRHRPEALYADRAYDFDGRVRRPLRQRRIRPRIARRGEAHGSGPGKVRWRVEAPFAWLFQFRRLRVRDEKRDDIHQALLDLACALICWRKLKRFC